MVEGVYRPDSANRDTYSKRACIIPDPDIQNQTFTDREEFKRAMSQSTLSGKRTLDVLDLHQRITEICSFIATANQRSGLEPSV